MKNNKEQWNEYLNNANVRPKTYTVTLERDRSGNFTVVGHQTKVLDVVNQHEQNWVRVCISFTQFRNQSCLINTKPGLLNCGPGFLLFINIISPICWYAS